MKKYINALLAGAAMCLLTQVPAQASSHREAPMIANDPLADNTDLYAFKSPNDPNKIIIIASYIPLEHPAGGPNWYSFGTNVRYEIHIKNNTATTGDDITYRFTFSQVNEDSTTFFNIRLGKQNLKTTYICERSVGGSAFAVIIASGTVPPPNIGPRSIDNATLGLGTTYTVQMANAISTASTGERIFAGPSDDPFFVDLGGIFDVGNFRMNGRDGVAKTNVHSIALEIPVATLQKSGLGLASAANILDPEYVIGVWASASRRQVSTLGANGAEPNGSGPWIQVSRLGMPLTNEAIIPIGAKDRWNAVNPSSDLQFAKYFVNPELALYMDPTQFGGAVPGLAALRIQSASRTDVLPGGFNFRNGKKGLWPLKGSAAVAGTALDDALFGTILLPDSMSPRAVDILPIFYTGVPNLAPYQLFTGKAGGNPLANGKPFINNFLASPTYIGGDMLRLNMAVPATPRNDPKFSSLGIVQAAVLGLTDPTYNTTAALQFIPNMDGFPNGRRLEDDVTTIELQAVSGVALAAIGMFYDDYTPPATTSPVTPNLVSVLGFNAGVTKNDTTFQGSFPFVQEPWRGFTGATYVGPTSVKGVGLSAPDAIVSAYPNPFQNNVTFKYRLAQAGNVQIDVVDVNGRTVRTLNEGRKTAGDYQAAYNGANLPAGLYFGRISVNGNAVHTVKLTKLD